MRCPANGERCDCAAGSIQTRECGRVALVVAERLREHPIAPVQHASAVNRARRVEAGA